MMSKAVTQKYDLYIILMCVYYNIFKVKRIFNISSYPTDYGDTRALLKIWTENLFVKNIF
jgi:hypothetical protein